MRLNHDCVRDFLLEIEDKLGLDEQLFLHQIEELDCVNTYGRDTVIYSILKLKEANYINASVTYADDEIYHLAVSSITFDGHSFLDNIRDNTVWRKTKEITSSVSSASIGIVANTAYTVLTSYIQSKLDL
ncbi:DUF2513 domain-containing protein [Caryophanon tenue]|uniref:DUF2513 domain-containing protein n=1 Tax=Caryophanon tenue TaxID=33978 RepID=A0A1C0Y528_9BACL|nr:DUF2513 domain-containing protein [Caryophanon tenue]OCS82270.1 hypothetical protein A6M13_07490 [Caryophanon tenue]